MYTFNLFPLHSPNGSNQLTIEQCSIKRLKKEIAEKLQLADDSFDVYCQGVQLVDDEKNFNEFEIENEDQLVVIPKMKLLTESNVAGASGLPSNTELHQSAKTIEMTATPNEFHRLYWLMKTPEFWQRLSQVIPELFLDSSILGLCEDSVLFCQNFDVKRLTVLVQGNPRLFKAIVQVMKEWTLSSNQTTQDVRLSPAAYFLNGSPHLVEPIAPRQPPVNVMPRRITNEDFFRALDQTTRTTASPVRPPPASPAAAAAQPQPQATTTTTTTTTPRSSARRNMISMDHLRNALQRTSTSTSTPTPVTTMDTTNGEPANLQSLLDQMRAMGLTDEAANRQALEAANWDLKAALDLLLG